MLAGYLLIDEIYIADHWRIFRACRTFDMSGTSDKTPVFIKLLHPEAASSVRLAQLRREYALLQTLAIDGVAQPIAFNSVNNQWAIVLKNSPGISLNELITGNHRNLKSNFRIASALASALTRLHTAGVIHRDIQPSNIIVDPESGNMSIIDFHHAIHHGHEICPSSQRSIAGSNLAYFSPEQIGIEKQRVDERSDLYSLGVLLYQLFTGVLPFDSSDPIELRHCHIARMPCHPQEQLPTLPRTLGDLIMRLLSKIPEERYQSASGLHFDLQRLMQTEQDDRDAIFTLGKNDVFKHLRIPQKLYGREKEITLLTDCLNRIAISGKSEIVLISGYSGVGKTSLVNNLFESNAAISGHFISGKFDQQKRDIPYAVITEAFQKLIQKILSESEERLAFWKHKLCTILGDYGQLVIDVIPSLKLIIGPQPAVSLLPANEAQNRFHMVLRKFISIFASRDCPLVLFLDDLHWADFASLMLIEDLLVHPEEMTFSVIGTYRDNEVNIAHPLMVMLDRIRKEERPVLDISLQTLTYDELTRFIADVLSCDQAYVKPLVTIIYNKTNGNPFYAAQFLSALHDEGLIFLDKDRRIWAWSEAEIFSREYTENVVHLLVEKLKRLSSSAQKILQFAACLGNTGEISILASICDRTQKQTHADIEDAVSANLLLQRDGTYTFIHDRVQEAAYSLMLSKDRSAAHLHIGRLLSSFGDEFADDKHIFDVANHFNLGKEMIVDAKEREQVARINLQAARRAKASSAFRAAAEFCAVGMQLVQFEPHDLIFSMTRIRAESELASSHFEKAADLAKSLGDISLTRAERAASLRILVEIHTALGQSHEALMTAIDCMKMYGLDLPSHPTEEYVENADSLLHELIGDRPDSFFQAMPLLEDEDIGIAISVLASMLPSAYFYGPYLHRLIACHIVELTIRHGVCEISPMGFSAYGFELSIMQRYGEGTRFGQIALDLVERHNFFACQAKVCNLVGATMMPWDHDLYKVIDVLQLGAKAGIENGDFIFSSITRCYITMTRLYLGEHLDNVNQDAEEAFELIGHTRFRVAVDMLMITHWFVHAVKGKIGANQKHRMPILGEAELLQHLSDQPIKAVIPLYHIYKLQLGVIFCDVSSALTSAMELKQFSMSLKGKTIQESDGVFFSALAFAMAWDTADKQVQRDLLSELKNCDAQLQIWANRCPQNFLHRSTLVAAEIARIEYRYMDAEHFYDRSILLSQEYGYTQNEALAEECSARFYRTRGLNDKANRHQESACSAYSRWGAHAKVDMLDRSQQKLTHSSEPSNSPRALLTSMASNLDLSAMVKAAQAISSEIIFDRLLDTLLRTVVENAGAQKGLLFLLRDDKFVLAGEAHVKDQVLQIVLHPVPQVIDSRNAPVSIINYVRRSLERLLLTDGDKSNPFLSDPYFASNRLKSLLCLPILRQAEMIGLLYLENNLVLPSFTPDRLVVLELLASQAAISLENARLFAELKQENHERKLAEAALLERESMIRHLVDSNIIGVIFWRIDGMILEANDAFFQITGYTHEDLADGKINLLVMTPSQYYSVDEKALQELLTNGSVAPFEKELICKNGKRVPVLMGGALFDGSMGQGVAFVLDLSEHKRAEAEHAARRSAEMSNRDKTRFLASASHDLRQPVQALALFAYALQGHVGSDKAKTLLANMERSIGALDQLLGALLNISKLDANLVEPHLINFKLCSLTDILHAEYSLQAQAKGVAFRLDIEEDFIVSSDRVLLDTILRNLLSNAIRYTNHGRITLSVKRFGMQAHITVHDTGIGIPPEQHQEIFREFYQVANSDSNHSAGLGLGLAIVKRLTSLLEHQMALHSEPGKGSRFTIILPLCDTLTDIEPEMSYSELPSVENMMIIVIDDEIEVRVGMQAMLERLGCAVITIRGEEDLLEKIQGLTSLDAIITDYQLRGDQTGPQVIEKLRRHFDADIPALIVTGDTNPDRLREAHASGYTIMHKPVRPAILSTYIKDIWDSYSTI